MSDELLTCPHCQQTECDCSQEVQAEALARAEQGRDALVIASDAVQQARRAKAQRKSNTEWANDLNWLMRHPQGRRVMWRVLSECGVYANAAVTAAFDTNTTFFKAGQQNIGLVYLNEIVTREPDAYALMVRENSATAKGNTA